MRTVPQANDKPSSDPAPTRPKVGRPILLITILGVAVLGSGAYYLWQNVANRRAVAADQAAATALRKLGVIISRNQNTSRTTSVNMRLVKDADTFNQAWPHVLMLPALESLDVTSTPITDEQLNQLAGNRTLTSLILADTSVTNDGIGAIEGMKLHSLNLGRTQITTEGLPAVGKTPALRILTLAETNTGDDFSALAKLPHLDWIVLSNMSISRAALEHLAEIESLSKIDLAGATLEEGAVDHFRSLKKNVQIDR